MSLPPPGPWGPGPQSPGPQQPPPGYYTPQQPWGPPHPPPKQSSGLKWLLIAVAVLLVVAISVGVTLFVTRSSGGGSTASPNAGDGIASANDTSPVSIITFEPTCQSWTGISAAIAQAQSNGWIQRDPNIPASAWNADQKGQYDAVAKSMRQTADQVVAFARQTPNRVVREVYEQYIAYSRAYADSIPTYTAPDNYLALASVAATYILDSVCNSITYGSASAQAASVGPVGAPSTSRQPQDPASPTRFITQPDDSCRAAISRRQGLLADTDQWSKQDPNVPADQWSPEQKAAELGVAPVLTSFAQDIESIAKSSDNATFQDLALFAAVYVRGFVNALPSYTPSDNYLIVAGSRANNLIIAACQAAGG